MATHIVLITFTDQGIRDINDSPARAASFEAMARHLGVEIEGLYWTSGGVDGVLLLNAPDDETASVVVLRLSSGGHVRSQILRAFGKSEMERIVGRL